MIKVQAICDSINPQGTRLLTLQLRYPKFIHQETLRHRTLYIHDCLYDPDFSFSVSSARAIPFLKLIEEVENDELRAKPEFWGCEQKGMSPGNELDFEEKQIAQLWWKRAALDAARNARAMAKSQGISDAFPWQIPHKSIVNRIIEPYLHVNCLTTGTTRAWMNFFGLRLDNNADPTLQILAQEAWKIWNESEPNKLEPGYWHLPFVPGLYKDTDTDPDFATQLKVSVARCARLSYLSFETNKRSTIDEDLKLYDRLIGSSPMHLSPAEHQATPDNQDSPRLSDGYPADFSLEWRHSHQSGNLEPGWRQFRKFLPNESLAPLPKEYKS
jgi:thymidylate synthase ThyX